MKYKIVGKLSDEKVKQLFKINKLENAISIQSNNNISKTLIKSVIIGALTIAITTAFGDNSLAAGTETIYKEPTELKPIFEFIDWLTMMVRVIVSSVIGLIATYAGYRWSTDLSPSGVSDAKKILKNCAVGILIVQFGAIVANYFIDKLQSLLL